MPNNEYGSSKLRLTERMGTNDPEFTVMRQQDGHATSPSNIDRGDGTQIPTWSNPHEPLDDYETPVGRFPGSNDLEV